jgi:hypothetical protein
MGTVAADYNLLNGGLMSNRGSLRTPGNLARISLVA